MEATGLSAERVVAAVDDHRRVVTDSQWTRIIVCHWLTGALPVFVDGEITKARWGYGSGRMQPEEITAQAAIVLRRELPAGTITREMDSEHVLALVAESFGYPLTCDPDEPFSTLYCGPGERATAVVHAGCIPVEFWLLGSFHRQQRHCEFVWAFRPDRYRSWFVSE